MSQRLAPIHQGRERGDSSSQVARIGPPGVQTPSSGPLLPSKSLAVREADEPESNDASMAASIAMTGDEIEGDVTVNGDYVLTLERDQDVYFPRERPLWNPGPSVDSGDDEDRVDPQVAAKDEAEPDEPGVVEQTNLERMRDLPAAVRSGIRFLVKHPWFDRFILLLVALNCIILAMDTPDLDSQSATGQFVAVANDTFVVLFTVEAFLKLLALGLMSAPDAYFRSAWNWLDFGIVLEGLISTLSGSGGSFSGLRAFRVLRPLKTVSRLAGLKVIVNALMASLPLLFNTLIVVSFYFVVFGIVGVQVWQGQFHRRCFFLETGLIDGNETRLCTLDGSGDFSCPPGRFCGSAIENPSNDVISFDNLLWAFSTIFTSITLEGWTGVMYNAMDTEGWWTVFYWVLLIVFGAFILKNLTLAVILTKFRESVEEQEAQKLLERTVKEREERLEKMTREYYEEHRRSPSKVMSPLAASTILSKMSSSSARSTSPVTSVRTPRAGSPPTAAAVAATSATTTSPVVAPSTPLAAAIQATSPASGSVKERRAVSLFIAQGGEYCEPEDPEESSTQQPTWVDHCLEATAACGRTTWDVFWRQGCVRWGKWFMRALLKPASRVLFPVVNHPVFDNTVLLCIIGNTVSLAIEHYGMDESLRAGLNMANLVFTVIFAVEMVLKLVALGFKGYWAEGFNRFDCLIVILSLIELGVGGAGSLAAFRAVRITRVLKIAKYLESIKMIVEVIQQSLESFGYIALLLLLFCFIYSVLGMQLFGGAFSNLEASQVPRNNFDDLFTAFLTVFQILAGEAWNEIMYDVLGAKKQPWYALFFISWVIIGQFILLNLFLAVLLDNFSDEEEADDNKSQASESSAEEEEEEEEEEEQEEEEGGREEGEDAKRDEVFGGAVATVASSRSLVPSKSRHFSIATSLASGAILPPPSSSSAASVARAHRAMFSSQRRLTKLIDATRGEGLVASRFSNRTIGNSAETLQFASADPDTLVPPSESVPAPSPLIGRSKSIAARAGEIIFNRFMTSGRSYANDLEEKLRKEKEQKQIRKKIVRQLLSRFRAVWLKVEEARSSLGSYAFKRSRHEVALMAMLPPPQPGVIFGSSSMDMVEDKEGSSFFFPSSGQPAAGDAIERLAQLARDPSFAHQQMTSHHSSLQVAAAIVSGRRRVLSNLADDQLSLSSSEEDDKESADKGDANLTHLQQAAIAARQREAHAREHRASLARHAWSSGEDDEPGEQHPGPPHAIHGSSSAAKTPGAAALLEDSGTGDVARALHKLEEVDREALEFQLACHMQRERARLQNERILFGEGSDMPAALVSATAASAASSSAVVAAAATSSASAAASRTASARAIHEGSDSPISSVCAAKLQLPPVSDSDTWALGINPSAPSMLDVDGLDPEERKRIMLANVIRMWQSKDHPVARQRRKDAAMAVALSTSVDASGRINLSESPQDVLGRLGSEVQHAAAEDVDFMWESIKARALLLERQLLPAEVKQARKEEETKLRVSSVPLSLETECRSRLLGRAIELPPKEGSSVFSAATNDDDSYGPTQTAADKKREVQARREFFAFQGTHLCCFPRHGPCATRCRSFVKDMPLCSLRCGNRQMPLKFDTAILILILISSILLAAEGPPPEVPPAVGTTAFSVLEIIFTVIFALEVIIKVIAFGFVIPPGSYLRESWNVIDFVVVLSSVLNITVSAAVGSSTSIGFLRTLRLLRCLRPLRVISRNEGMRIVVTALLRSVSDIGNVMVVLSLVWLIFAILGVQLFGGKLHACNDPAFPPDTPRDGILNAAGTGWLVAPCSSNFTFDAGGGELVPRQWLPTYPNFDNVFSALLMLFIMSSGETWPSVMFNCIDATGVDRSMKQDSSRISALYFFAFIIIGTFFFLNLFTGVVFDNFLRLKKEMDSSGVLTEGQREWVRRARGLLRIKPDRTIVAPHRTRQSARRAVFNIIQSAWFQNLIMLAIVLNVTIMATSFYGEPPIMSKVLDVLNYIFTGLFILEAILKIFALTFQQYIANPWNRFDFVVVLGSVCDIVFASLDGFELGSLLGKIFRIARVLRIVRLGKSISGLRRLIVTLVSSIPALVNVGSLLLLLFFIYAIMGVQSFGSLGNEETLTVHANFRTFGVALLTLFRISTGEGWDGFLFESESQGHPFAWVFFVSFVTIASFIMLNLFITIIVEEFETSEAETDGMSDSHLQAFKIVWRYFDPQGIGRIRVKDLEHFLRHLPEPMGLPIDSSSTSGASLASFLRRLQELDLDSHHVAGSSEQWVFFHEILSAVHRTSFRARIPSSILKDMKIHPTNVKRKAEKKAIKESLHRSFQSDSNTWFPALRAKLALFQAGEPQQALSELSASRQQGLPVAKIMATVAIRQAFGNWTQRSRQRSQLRRDRDERRRKHLQSIALEAGALEAGRTAPSIEQAKASPWDSPVAVAQQAKELRLVKDLRPEDIEAMSFSHMRVLAARLRIPFNPDTDTTEELRANLHKFVSVTPKQLKSSAVRRSIFHSISKSKSRSDSPPRDAERPVPPARRGASERRTPPPPPPRTSSKLSMEEPPQLHEEQPQEVVESSSGVAIAKQEESGSPESKTDTSAPAEVAPPRLPPAHSSATSQRLLSILERHRSRDAQTSSPASFRSQGSPVSPGSQALTDIVQRLQKSNPHFRALIQRAESRPSVSPGSQQQPVSAAGSPAPSDASEPLSD
jgi:hypothetical protein